MNGDKFLDAYELETIFQHELDKMYDPSNPEVSIHRPKASVGKGIKI